MKPFRRIRTSALPHDVVIDRRGIVYVACYDSINVIEFNSEGIREVIPSQVGGKRLALVDDDQNLIVATQQTDLLMIVNLRNGERRYLEKGIEPTGLVSDVRDGFWIGDAEANRLVHIGRTDEFLGDIALHGCTLREPQQPTFGRVDVPGVGQLARSGARLWCGVRVVNRDGVVAVSVANNVAQPIDWSPCSYYELMKNSETASWIGDLLGRMRASECRIQGLAIGARDGTVYVSDCGPAGGCITRVAPIGSVDKVRYSGFPGRLTINSTGSCLVATDSDGDAELQIMDPTTLEAEIVDVGSYPCAAKFTPQDDLVVCLQDDDAAVLLTGEQLRKPWI